MRNLATVMRHSSASAEYGQQSCTRTEQPFFCSNCLAEVCIFRNETMPPVIITKGIARR
jgi:hypothetical protein